MGWKFFSNTEEQLDHDSQEDSGARFFFTKMIHNMTHSADAKNKSSDTGYILSKLNKAIHTKYSKMYLSKFSSSQFHSVLFYANWIYKNLPY